MILAMSELPSRLSVVTLGTRDLPGLRRFYRGLGWEEIPSSDDEWAGFLLGGVLLALYPVDELAAEAATAIPSPAGWSGITLACNVDSPQQVDAAFTTAVAAGAVAVADPVDRPWGGRSAYIADPEGNRWEIAWASGARFDDRGALTGFGS
ncbi:VOC family protein [Streptomyces xiamenensis]|uniref:Glyoxalase/bleomycin resistance protein/dioxygenase n=1 Tax=Streptomyces xiamenensis TaxID=408015 RepID=A0A0F7FNW5_9ACTN|nr:MULTISPECIES: VOC family protein [Streptomyces]AKG41664.1 Glyoxalase/bleomycin resistance protein/dioxygenase [Streptomyces xiamenensis]